MNADWLLVNRVVELAAREYPALERDVRGLCSIYLGYIELSHNDSSFLEKAKQLETRLRNFGNSGQLEIVKK
jgi:hypothetical protein